MSALIAEEIVSEPSRNMSAITVIKEDQPLICLNPPKKLRNLCEEGTDRNL